MKDFLDKASKAYYEGNPIITDEEFDELANRLDFEDIGYVSDFRFSHLYPMYSLQKVYPGDKIPFETDDTVIVTPKLDGAAVSIRYSDGLLVLALTRGDGKKGLDVTEKVKTLVPNSIRETGEVQITGEVVAPKHIENARNYAAGSLNLKSLEEFHSRPLTFIAYGMQPRQCENWSSDMIVLNDYRGFNTVIGDDWLQYPQDGQVFRIDDHKEYDGLGHTSRHPRGAFALKQRPEGVVTKLLDVIWKVGKSGVVSPVAILEPVMVGDAKVSRATLHNISYIEGLDLEIGCDVEVVRAGEIIPRVVRRI